MTNSNENKLSWSPPTVTVYGDVEQITLQSKLKNPGTIDDFGVAGVSDAP